MARRAHCMDCGAEVNNFFDKKIEIARRGNRNAWLCEHCAAKKLSYYFESDKHTGKANKDGHTCGVELETSYTSTKARAEIMMNGYIPTSDCTVDTEYKSPIMEGLNGFSKHCETFERLILAGEMRIGEECGTHFHYGNRNYLNPNTMDYVRRFYHSLFLPLSNEMKMHHEANIQLWGRDFGGWSQAISADSHPMEHTNFINVQHDWTLEFRICKFTSAAQMMNAARLTKRIGNIVMNFIEGFNDEPKDKTRYSNKTEYRKHKAAVCGEKIRKAYLKAIGE